MIAASRLVARRALSETIEVGRTRLWDGILLIVSIAVLYVLRGATRDDLDGSIRDALWFFAVLPFFLFLVFTTRAIAGARTLGTRWKAYVLGAPGHPSLHLEQRVRFDVAACRCQLQCEDGSRFEANWIDSAADNHGLGPIAHFPATFIPAPDGDGPGGDYRVEWSWKERPHDGWVKAAADRFSYDPALYRASAQEPSSVRG